MEKTWGELDKFFSANKLFVAFCGVLIIVWVALQVVMHLRIIEIAKLDASKIFTWSWPISNAGVLSSSTSNSCAQVVKNSSTEVVVKVTGKQALEKHLIAANTDKRGVVMYALVTSDDRKGAKDALVTSDDRRGAKDALVTTADRKGAKDVLVATDDRRGALHAPADVDKRSLDCEATLTYYRSDNRWILGKVELK